MISANLGKILFLDIETVPVANSLMELSPRMMDIWINRSEKEHGREADHSETFINESSFYGEYAKVCCISYGYIIPGENSDFQTKIQSSCGEDEKTILAEFSKVLSKSAGFTLCGHNIFLFDIPFLCKRYIFNGMQVPQKLNYSKLKPWEITDIDTMSVFKFGAFIGKNISLDLLSACLDIQSPKDEMNGAQVKIAYQEKRFDDIAKYCQKDVETVARIMQKINGLI